MKLFKAAQVAIDVPKLDFYHFETSMWQKLKIRVSIFTPAKALSKAITGLNSALFLPIIPL